MKLSNNTIYKYSIYIALFAILYNIFISYLAGGWMAKYTSPSYSFHDIPNLSDKVAFVTGTNTGIGYHTALELARKGCHVFASARSIEKGTNAVKQMIHELQNDGISNPKIEFIQTDLASMRQLKEFGQLFKKKNMNIDILIFNAGVMNTPFTLTEEGYELQIGVNFLGHFLLFKILEAYLVSKSARVIHTSSLAHWFPYYPNGIDFKKFQSSKGYNSFLAYGQSKLANILFSNEMAKRYHGKLSSNSLHPGSIVTDLDRYSLPSWILENAWIMNILTKVKLFTIFMDAPTGAMTQLYLATSPKVANITGKYFKPIAIETSIVPFYPKTDIDVLASELWEYGEKAVKSFIV